MSTLWQGRMSQEPSDALLDFTASIGFDVALADLDVLGSQVHVAGLERAGLLTKDESQTLHQALDQVADELAQDSFVFLPTDEDIHTAVERRVTQLAGEVGEKLHTGRSRNDQVALDLRLYAKRELLDIASLLAGLAETLLARARQSPHAPMPGYTHLQRAQPVPLAHYLLAHGWTFARDLDRLAAAVARLDVSPLGAGALGGTSLGLDPDWTARELGFAAAFENSMDAVSDRDFVAEALFVLALVGVHLSRLGEEVVFFSSQEAGYFELADTDATGSSMLPHKKNPDIAELARGKSGRLIGNLTGLLATLKGLPLAYNRDLQEDKEPLFDSVRQVRLGLLAMTGLFERVRFDEARLAAAAGDPALVAVDLADFLVRRKVPFRQAHQRIAGLVAQAAETGVSLKQLVLDEPDLGAEAAELCELGSVLDSRVSRGGAGTAAVEQQLVGFERRLGELRDVVGAAQQSFSKVVGGFGSA